MKRLRSYGDDLDTGALKDWGGRRDRDRERDTRDRERDTRDRERDREREREREQDPERSSSSSHHYRNRWKNGLSSSSSSYDRVVEDDRDASRSLRKRQDHDLTAVDKRRKSYERRDRSERSERGVSISPSPRGMHRSESFSFSGSRRGVGEFVPKGFRSERSDRSRREESVSSWRRLCGGSGSKDGDEELGRGSGRVGNVKSPSESRERELVKSPTGSRELGKSPFRSPTGSRELGKSPFRSPVRSRGSSRSSEVKKDEKLVGESSNSSEMEEGELEPEANECRPEFEIGGDAETGMDVDGGRDENLCSRVNAKSRSNEVIELGNEENVLAQGEEKGETSMLEMMKEASKEIGELRPECEGNSFVGVKEGEDLRNGSGGKDENMAEERKCLLSLEEKNDREENVKCVNVDGSLPLEEREKGQWGTDVDDEVGHSNFVDPVEVNMVENRRNEVTLNLISDNLSGKDKGKSLAMSPSHEADSMGKCQWVEKDFLACRDNAMEGPSTRGFELFSSSIVTKPEKTSNSGLGKDEKLKTEPLELSLGLPDVLLPLPSHDHNVGPSSPSRAMSVQSLPSTYHTTSDGFNGSMSFSGSQSFFHNPSCSLTQNSFENYEQSVGSKPLFQGIDWQSQSLNDPKRKETSVHQRMLVNGNGSHAQTSQGIVYPQVVQVQQHLRLSEGSSGVPVGLDRQSSFRRQLSGVQLKNCTETRSPTQSVGSRETRSEFSKDKKQIGRERSGSLFRSNSQREMEQLVIGGSGFVERIIGMIVSEPVQVMARRIQEIGDQPIAFVKESACEIIVNKDKRGQLHAFQEALQNRSDLTLDVLLKSHRAQLEILVAIKTGLQDFLRKSNGIHSSDLAEIFLYLKCRNLACRSLLPVDECDCKVCLQKNGFCSSCMCLICSKFDMASNTCSWVGCDVCLHWCHTECGIRKSYIRNGQSVNGAQETTEMQFHCVACNHPSELFGFVKEVFRTCAKDWKAEALSKELEYVKRIFSASNDVRGKQLHRVAELMMARLENKSNLTEVYSYIMRFFAESEFDIGNSSASTLKELPRKNPGEGSNGIARPSHEASWMIPVSTENSTHRENASAPPPRLDWDQMGGRSGNPDLRMNIVKKPVMDELESIVMIKQAEAKMFQARADDARREAEGLKRIALAKGEKIEEEYSSRITKLRLAETEERRKQKVEELQILEREHHEYFSMKMRMETEIRDLLLKMEATKQNFIT